MSFLPTGLGSYGQNGADEVAQLFTTPSSSAPAGGFVAIAPNAGSLSAPNGAAASGVGAGGSSAPTPPSPGGYAPHPNTLDEPIKETILRDVRRVGQNLVLVAFPFKDRSQQSTALRNWDLWGPMAFTIALAACLSARSPDLAAVFSLVFALVSVGAVALTLNVVLLGGSIGFFQSLCLLGYCLFPLNVVAIICLVTTNTIARWIVAPLGVAWASWASVPFVVGAVPANRRALAVYPLGLLYVTLGWLALIS